MTERPAANRFPSEEGFPRGAHALADLGIAVELRPDGTASGTQLAPVAGMMEVDGEPWLTAGSAAALVDTVAAAVAVMSARPDRVATADLTLSMTAPLRSGTLAADARLARRGRTTVVVGVRLADGEGGPVVGRGLLTFSVLAARPHQLLPEWSSEEVVRTRFGEGDLELDLLAAMGIEPAGEAGKVRMVHSPYVENTFGAVQGGLVVALAEAPVRHLDGGGVPVGLQVAYLAPCTGGPFSAVAHRDGPGAFAVSVVDHGAEDRIATRALVRTVPSDAGR